MDEIDARTGPGADPFRALLRDDGAWAAGRGRRLRHAQSGEVFVRIALPAGADPERWEELVEALACVHSPELIVPRAVIDDGAALLYAETAERTGESFAETLEAGAADDQLGTLGMAADIAAALRDLHAAGAVLGRLRLQDVLRADDGWVLLVGPESAARVAAGAQLEEQGAADVVLLASAAITVLTGRRPSEHRARAPLRATHPLLPVVAADALDGVLDRARDPAADGSAMSARELEALLRPDALSGAEAGTGSRPRTGPAGRHPSRGGGNAVVPADGAPEVRGTAVGRGGDGGADDRRDDGDTEVLPVAVHGPVAAQGRTGPRGGERRRTVPAEDRRFGTGTAGGAAHGLRQPRPIPARTRRGRRDPRRTGAVLLGAAAIVVAAGALSGWQVLSGVTGGADATSAAGQAAGRGAADMTRAPGETGAAEETDVPSAAASPDGGTAPAGAAPEAAPTRAASDPQGPHGGGTAGTGDTDGADADVSAEHSPEYAAAALISLCADALREDDRRLLDSVYAPGASDLHDDRATLEDARGSGAFSDLTMVLARARPLPSDAGAEGEPPPGPGDPRTAAVS